MKCSKCGADNENSKFCSYCGCELKDAEVLAMQIIKTYYLTGRGFMVNGIAKVNLKANGFVRNSRTKKSFGILYMANSKFKLCKSAEEGQEYTLCLSGASGADFEENDNLVI